MKETKKILWEIWKIQRAIEEALKEGKTGNKILQLREKKEELEEEFRKEERKEK